MKYEKLLVDKLYDNIGSCIIISKNDLLSTKLEKYLKRYMGKSIRLNYDIVDSNILEDINSYFSFIAPKLIILMIHDSVSTNLTRKILDLCEKLSLQLLILTNTKDDIPMKTINYNNVNICKIPNIYGFNEEDGELQKNFYNKKKDQKFTLVDDVTSKIAQAIAEKDLSDLKSKLSISNYEENDCLKIAEKQKNCSLRLLYKGDPNEYILGKNVGDFRIELGIKLSKKIDVNIIKRVDYIVPVPSSGIFYAVGLSKALKIPFLPALRKLEISERAFEIQNIDMRKSYLCKNMEVNGHLIKGKKLLIVDEAIFTGATLKVVCDILKENGALEVHIAIPSPKCFKNCEYLVQPERQMLLNKINESSIAKYFDVESVTYLDLKDYEREFSSIDNICIECFHLLNNKGE